MIRDFILRIHHDGFASETRYATVDNVVEGRAVLRVGVARSGLANTISRPRVLTHFSICFGCRLKSPIRISGVLGYLAMWFWIFFVNSSRTFSTWLMFLLGRYTLTPCIRPHPVLICTHRSV